MSPRRPFLVAALALASLLAPGEAVARREAAPYHPATPLPQVAAPTPAPPTGPVAPAWLETSAEAVDRPPMPADVPADRLVVRWLGTAGFALQTAKALVYLDPYFSRTGLWALLTKPARPEPAAIAAHVPDARSFPLPRAVFVGHAHFDHLLDAPSVAARLGCNLHSSDEALRVAVAEGLPGSQCLPLDLAKPVHVGDLTIESYLSSHSPMPTQLLAGGHMPQRIETPIGFLDYKNGPVFNFLVRWRGRTIFHTGSASVSPALRGQAADVALVCVSGWTSNRGVWDDLARAVLPAVVVPMHHDDFFKPYSEGVIDNPLANRPEALAAAARAMPRTWVVEPKFFAPLVLRPAERTPR